MFWPLTAAIVAAGIGDLTAIWFGQRTWRYLFKPGTMLLIIALAATGLPGAGSYGYLVLAGLLFSVAGDIFLVLPSDRFIGGLISFFIAHLFYIVAFTAAGPFSLSDALVAAGLIAVGGLLFRHLKPGVLAHGGKGMLLPVFLYLTVISAMVLRAAMAREALVLGGALLFYLSDGILAWDRFVRPFERANLAIMTTYFGAQYLIALSVIYYAG